MTDTEIAALLEDTSKSIGNDIDWREDEDHSPAVEFRAEVMSEPGYPLFIRGSYNRITDKLSYSLIHRSVGRIYGLCLGQDHHNPSCLFTGEKHKHVWTEEAKDKEAYVPDDITHGAAEPVAVWKQFCLEAKITHNGVLHAFPPIQTDTFV